MENKIFDKIVNSVSLDKGTTGGGRYEAPCTLYYFDGFQVKECNNGAETVRLIVQGSEIARVSRDIFRGALKARDAKIAANFWEMQANGNAM